MIQKINEAELLQTPVHNIMTSFLARNCPDAQLCLELLRSDYVSLNGMVNRALTYKQAQSVIKKLAEEVNAVQAKKRSQYQQGKPPKINQPLSNLKARIRLLKRNVLAVIQRNTKERIVLIRTKFAVSAKSRDTSKVLAEKKKQKDKDSTANYVKEECQNEQNE